MNWRLGEQCARHSPPAVQTLRAESGDFTTITEVIAGAGWEQDYAQVQRGRFSGVVEIGQIGPVQVASINYDGQILARGLSPPGCVTLAIVDEVQGNSTWRGQRVTRGFGIVSDGISEVDLLMGRRMRMALVVVPRETLDCSLPDLLPDRLEIPAELWKGLGRLARHGLEAAKRGQWAPCPEAAAAYAEEAICLVDSAFCAGRTDGHKRLVGAPLADRLEHAIRRMEGDPLSVREIACELQVSERTLRRASLGTFGMGPKQLSKVIRLNEVRRELRQGGEGVHIWEAAARHGFWHMGQFGRDYRDLFGELPSETLARAGAA